MLRTVALEQLEYTGMKRHKLMPARLQLMFLYYPAPCLDPLQPNLTLHNKVCWRWDLGWCAFGKVQG